MKYTTKAQIAAAQRFIRDGKTQFLEATGNIATAKSTARIAGLDAVELENAENKAAELLKILDEISKILNAFCEKNLTDVK